MIKEFIESKSSDGQSMVPMLESKGPSTPSSRSMETKWDPCCRKKRLRCCKSNRGLICALGI